MATRSRAQKKTFFKLPGGGFARLSFFVQYICYANNKKSSSCSEDDDGGLTLAHVLAKSRDRH